MPTVRPCQVPRPGIRLGPPEPIVSGRWRQAVLAIGIGLVLGGCGSDAISPAFSLPPSRSSSPSAAPGPSAGTIEPAPGSESAIYAPNPGAVVVAIDAGHGGCLDWGVPDPSERS